MDKAELEQTARTLSKLRREYAVACNAAYEYAKAVSRKLKAVEVHGSVEGVLDNAERAVSNALYAEVSKEHAND